MSLPLNTKNYPFFAASYQTREGYRIGLAQEGPKVTHLVMIDRPIKVVSIRKEERDYVTAHSTTTLKSWVHFLNEARPRLGITKTAELYVYAAAAQLEAKANDDTDTTRQDNGALEGA